MLHLGAYLHMDLIGLDYTVNAGMRRIAHVLTSIESNPVQKAYMIQMRIGEALSRGLCETQVDGP